MIKTSIYKNIKNEKLLKAVVTAMNYEIKKKKNLKKLGHINYKNKIIYIKSDLEKSENVKLANFVIKHEFAHAILYNYGLAQSMSVKNREYWADLLAYQILCLETSEDFWIKYVRDKSNVKLIADNMRFEKIIYLIEDSFKKYPILMNNNNQELIYDNYKVYSSPKILTNIVQGTTKTIAMGAKIIIAIAEKAVQKAAGIKR